MKTWLATLPQWLQQGSDCVLVTVLHVLGSTPREAGASMLLRVAHPLNTSLDKPSDQFFPTQQPEQIDTIGGGHLEWQACQIAHEMLKNPNDVSIRVERFNLGARLGQCCGGMALVVFEKIAATQASIWQQRIAAMTTQASSQYLKRVLTADASESIWSLEDLHSQSSVSETASLTGNIKTDKTDGWVFQQTLLNHQFVVVIFGAGHVGNAVVQALLPLEAKIIWVDVRDHIFPEICHSNLSSISTDTPEYEIAHAPANSYFLIMTHNHALDLALCQQLFKRSDYAYFGLIGSRSKRAVFERRLLERGVQHEQLEQLICPIGVQGISSKEPAAIAVSVVAQLLQVKSSQQHNSPPFKQLSSNKNDVYTI